MSKVSELQAGQERIIASMRARVALNAASAPVNELYGEYQAAVSELSALLGPKAPCSQVDPMTWDTYCDAYQALYRRAPHYQPTMAEAVTFIQITAWEGRHDLAH